MYMLTVIVALVLNFALVLAAIVLFMAPFYALYRRHHQPANTEEPLSFNRHLEYFFTSKYANWLIFFWAMSEAIVWFVIPEFVLLLLIFMRIHRKRELLL